MDRNDCLIVITAEAPAALLELCGISLLERLLRNLQRLGFREATLFSSTPAIFAQELARPSWPRAEILCHTRQQSGTGLAADDLLQLGGATSRRALITAANGYCDPRLLQALSEQKGTAVFVDAAPPATLRPLLPSEVCGAAMIELAWLKTLTPEATIWSAVSLESELIARIDVAAQPSYVTSLRRSVRPLWFPAPIAQNHSLAERLLLETAQNGTLDLPAKVHAPIETWMVARLCKTAITPNQITLFTATVSIGVTTLFASGHLGAGTLLALAVGVLDGLDGKQARVKVETTPLGKREHLLDYVLELSWWSALAYHFRATTQLPQAYALLLLLVGADVVDRLAKKKAKQLTGRNLDDVAAFDRFVRLIGARRNIYVWIFAAGLALGIAHKAFLTLCWWGALTAAVHVLRAWWINRRAA